MPEEIKEEEKIEIETTEMAKGKIQVFGKISNPTPARLANWTKGLRYTATGLITMISGTDLFSGGQAKIICFGLGAFILLLGGIDMSVGVKPEENK